MCRVITMIVELMPMSPEMDISSRSGLYRGVNNTQSEICSNTYLSDNIYRYDK